MILSPNPDDKLSQGNDKKVQVYLPSDKDWIYKDRYRSLCQ